MEKGTWKAKAGLAQMLKGGVIMDVVTFLLSAAAVTWGKHCVVLLKGQL